VTDLAKGRTRRCKAKEVRGGSRPCLYKHQGGGEVFNVLVLESIVEIKERSFEKPQISRGEKECYQLQKAIQIEIFILSTLGK